MSALAGLPPVATHHSCFLKVCRVFFLLAYCFQGELAGALTANGVRLTWKWTLAYMPPDPRVNFSAGVADKLRLSTESQ